MSDTKSHFWIACVEVTFVDGDGNTGITRVNSMIKSETMCVGVKLLGRTQQAAQLQLVKSLNDEKVQFLNAVFVSISHLGKMSDAEFHAQDDAPIANQLPATVGNA